jgi:hypothetical protein
VVSDLLLIQHLAELLGRDAGILHRVRRLPMPVLFLHGGDVAGLGDDMLARRVAGAKRGAALHLGHLTDGIPDDIDGARRQATGALGHGRGRHKQGGGRPGGRVVGTVEGTR